MTLGEKIVLLRRARSMSQEQLAEQLGVSRQAVSKWELDEAVPDVARVLALSELFGVTTDYLLKSGGAEAGGEEPLEKGKRAPIADGAPDRKWLGMALVIVSSLGIFGMWAVEQVRGVSYWINGRFVGTGFSGLLQYSGWMLLIFLGLLLCFVGGIRLLKGKPFLSPVFTEKFWRGKSSDSEEPDGADSGMLSEKTKRILRGEEDDE